MASFRKLSVLAVVAAAALVSGEEDGDKFSPNFLIYQADNMEFFWPEEPTRPPGSGDRVESVPTPFLDRLRDEGTVFTRAYTTAPKCTPSRYSTLTGRYPSRSVYSRWLTNACTLWQYPSNGVSAITDVTVNSTKMDGSFDQENNIATVLKGLGYSTGMFGKWHLSEYDDDERSVQFYEMQRAKAVATNWDVVEAFYIGNLNDGGFNAIEEGYSHNIEWIVAEVMEFFEENLNAGTPFFAYVNPTPPHKPSILEALQDLTSDQTAAGKLDVAPNAGTMSTRENLDKLVETYGSENDQLGTLWVDDGLGALFNCLEKFDALDDTLVLFLSDQGTALTLKLYEHGVRVPFFVRYPRLFQAGLQTDRLVSTIDILPTFVEIARMASKQKMPEITVDGQSFKSLGSGEVSDEFIDRTIFLEMTKNRAAVTQKYKLLRVSTESCGNCWAKSGTCNNRDTNYPYFADETQLYDLETSPDEQVNVADMPAYSSMLAKLNAALDAHLACTLPTGPAHACIVEGSPGPTPAPPPKTPAPTNAPYSEYGAGRCKGSLLEAMSEGTLAQCLETCKGNTGCGYFSYNSEDGLCRINRLCSKLEKPVSGWVAYEPN